jgi:hypothetical protein
MASPKISPGAGYFFKEKFKAIFSSKKQPSQNLCFAQI